LKAERLRANLNIMPK